jgi:putative peptidoglycan lipid II flippase
MLRLLRVMFPYMLLVCLAAAFMGMLNARGHFFIPAMGATMLNVVMIASVFWLVAIRRREWEQKLPCKFSRSRSACWRRAWRRRRFNCRRSGATVFATEWVSPWKNETVRLVVTRMIPGTIGVAAFQINVTLVLACRVLGRHRKSSRHSIRRAPDGIAAGNVRHFAGDIFAADAFGPCVEKKYPEFRATLRHGVGTLLFLNLIASVLLVVLAEPIVRLLFEGGTFDAVAPHRLQSR